MNELLSLFILLNMQNSPFRFQPQTQNIKPIFRESGIHFERIDHFYSKVT